MRFIGGLAIVSAAVISASFPATAQSADGGTLYNQRCKVCHTVVAGAPGTVGPNLRGIVGRKSAKGKFSYSPAMAKSALVWNAATLDKYLTAPTKMVPGTKMVIGVSDAAQRKAIIAWLATQK